MKNTVRLIIAMLGVTMLLTACNDPQSVVESPSAQETSPSESGKKSSLPDAYQYRNGTLFLIWEKSVDSPRSRNSLKFESVEEMREKFMNLSFTEEERAFIEDSILHEDHMAVIDPRLLTPLNLPKGAFLKEVSFQSLCHASTNVPTSYFFLTTISSSEGYNLGQSFSASMNYRGGAAKLYYETVVNAWIDKDGGYETSGFSLMEETTYNGYPALRLENNPSDLSTPKHVVWRYIAKENGRTYYVENNAYYRTNDTSEVSSRSFKVSTLHGDCEYLYTISNPTEECVDNFFKYDPFTYVEIVE